MKYLESDAKIENTTTGTNEKKDRTLPDVNRGRLFTLNLPGAYFSLLLCQTREM